jgi:hypothetical protein
MRYLVTTEAPMSGIRATTSAGPALTGQAWPHGHRSISLLGHPRSLLITECGRLAVAAHARSADMYAQRARLDYHLAAQNWLICVGWSSKLLSSCAIPIYAERAQGPGLSRFHASSRCAESGCHGAWFWNWNWMRAEPSSGTISVESLADHSSGTRNIRFWPSISRRRPRYR